MSCEITAHERSETDIAEANPDLEHRFPVDPDSTI